MGFFAAIVIECDDVVLDLNNHYVKQSITSSLQQRFFACIETSSSPFILKYWSGEFGTVFSPAPIVYMQWFFINVITSFNSW